MRFAADRLDLPKETQAGLVARTRASGHEISPKLLDAGDRRERDALAGVVAHPGLKRILQELGPEHFDSELHRRAREYLLESREADAELVGFLAELDARGAAEGIDERTAEELLLRLRERQIRRELGEADQARTLELQAALAKIHAAVENLASAPGARTRLSRRLLHVLVAPGMLPGVRWRISPKETRYALPRRTNVL